MSRIDKQSGSDSSDADGYKPTLNDSETSDYDEEVMKTPSKKRAKKAAESPTKKNESPKRGRGGLPGQKVASWSAEEELMLFKEAFGDTLPPLSAESVKRLSAELGRTSTAIKLHWSAMRQKLFSTIKASS